MIRKPVHILRALGLALLIVTLSLLAVFAFPWSLELNQHFPLIALLLLLPLAGIPATRMQYMTFPPKNEMKDCPDTPRVFSR